MDELLSHIGQQDFVSWVLTALIGYGVKTMNELNENLKIIVLRVDTHQKTLDDHETRLREVE